MPLRNRILILVGAGIVVIGGITLILYLNAKKKTSAPQNTTPVETVSEQLPEGVIVAPAVRSTTIPVGAKVKPATKEEVTESTLRQLARVFVERYHTYSSENNYQNIKDVQSIVTLTYWNKISAPIYSKAAASGFIAVTTEVIGITSSDMGSSSGEVGLKARKISTNNGTSATVYVDYVVSFTKVGSSWLISGETVKTN